MTTLIDMHYPLEIIDKRASGLLCIRWDDERYSELPHALLRARCRCAACQQGERSGQPDAIDDDVRLTDLHMVSDKALNLVFSDGHDRGIYPWTYLRELA